MNDDEKSRKLAESAPSGERTAPDRPMVDDDPNCMWAGQEYGPGATVCDSGRLYECLSNGQWTYRGGC